MKGSTQRGEVAYHGSRKVRGGRHIAALGFDPLALTPAWKTWHEVKDSWPHLSSQTPITAVMAELPCRNSLAPTPYSVARGHDVHRNSQTSLKVSHLVAYHMRSGSEMYQSGFLQICVCSTPTPSLAPRTYTKYPGGVRQILGIRSIKDSAALFQLIKCLLQQSVLNTYPDGYPGLSCEGDNCKPDADPNIPNVESPS